MNMIKIMNSKSWTQIQTQRENQIDHIFGRIWTEIVMMEVQISRSNLNSDCDDGNTEFLAKSELWMW